MTLTNENININNNYQEQEISSETISRYVNNIHDLSILTGKLDMILSYSQQFHSDDKFLLQSLNSILEDVIMVNQDNRYKRMSCSSETEIASIQVSEKKEGVLNTKEVQTSQKKIKGALKANLKDNNENIVEIDTNIIEHIFKNSSLLYKLIYNRASQKLRVEFKSNGRLYDYFSVPFDKINKLIALDEVNQNPGKYFASDIKSLYGYREVTTDSEEKVG